MKKTNEQKSMGVFELVSRLYSYVIPYKWVFFIATIGRVLSEILMLYPAFAYAKIVDFFSVYKPGQSLKPFFTVLIIWIVTSIIRFIVRGISHYKGFVVATKANHDTEETVVNHLLKLNMNWHEGEFTGSKIKRIARGSNAVERMLRIFLADFIPIAVGTIGTLIIIGSLDMQSNMLLLIFILTYGGISIYFQKKAVKASKAVAIADEKRGGIVHELINNVRTIKVLNIKEPLLVQMSDYTSTLLEKIKTRIAYFQGGGHVAGLYGNIFLVFSIVVIGTKIANGYLTLGFLILFYGYFNRIWDNVMSFAQASEDFATHKSDFERMQLLLEEKPSIDVEEGKVSFPKDWSLIQLKNLSFKYNENPVLNSINLDIKRGQKIGIVGLSGAGKSTLFKLLSKENESYEGEIDVDGVPLKTISKSDYLNNATVVLQETELFNNSLAFNITFGTNPDKELLEKAITTSHVREFVSKLKDGLETVVGEKGVKLSGGEKQRVGIARAVYKNPQILLMDEATSHLDIESEKKIQDSLHEFFKSVTAIVIAHRLTTIKEMDTIVLIEDGKISEQGSFDELYAKQGRFFELWSKQKL